MRRFTPSVLKDLLSGCLLTGGFTVISAGIAMICGTGYGLIAGGIGRRLRRHISWRRVLALGLVDRRAPLDYIGVFQITAARSTIAATTSTKAAAPETAAGSADIDSEW